jgi:hypothetical protein
MITKLELKQDLNYIEVLINQINNVYMHMATQTQTTDTSNALQFSKDIEIYKSKIEGLKAKNKIDKGSMANLVQGSFSISEGLKKQVTQFSEVMDKNKPLIQEHKDKEDAPVGIVTEYKGFKNENETIKTLLASSEERNIDLSNKITAKDIEIGTLKAKLEAAAMQAPKEVKRICEQKEFEKEKALLEQEKLFNKNMQTLQEQSNKKIWEYQKQTEDFIREIHLQQQSQGKKPEVKKIEKQS